MIIEFDGYGINEYVIGLNRSLNELRTMYLNVKNEEISNEDLLSLFCVHYHYKKSQNYYEKTSRAMLSLI